MCVFFLVFADIWWMFQPIAIFTQDSVTCKKSARRSAALSGALFATSKKVSVTCRRLWGSWVPKCSVEGWNMAFTKHSKTKSTSISYRVKLEIETFEGPTRCNPKKLRLVIHIYLWWEGLTFWTFFSRRKVKQQTENKPAVSDSEPAFHTHLSTDSLEVLEFLSLCLSLSLPVSVQAGVKKHQRAHVTN